jgi:1-deoxy-D-xylulose-5-phosphate synthase
MVLPDRFIAHDKPERQYDQAGLAARHIVAAALTALGRERALAEVRALAGGAE